MYPIGEAARRSGLTIETIRYYEREGIIARPGRTSSGRRAFAKHEIAELRFIKRCRALGFSLADAMAMRDLAHADADSCGPAASLGKRQLDSVRAKIAELASLESALDELVASCASGKAHCPMLATLLSG